MALILLLGLGPLAVEGIALCVGTWKEFMGVSDNVKTPALDGVQDSLNDMSDIFWSEITPLSSLDAMGSENCASHRGRRDGDGHVDAAAELTSRCSSFPWLARVHQALPDAAFPLLCWLWLWPGRG